jgi:hypothetical protein
MKLLIVGYDYPGLVQAFESAGHQVTHGEAYSWWLWKHNKGTDAAYGEHIVKACAGHDALIMGKGWDSNDDGTLWMVPPGAIAEIARRGTKTVYWSHDDPYSVSVFCRRQMWQGYAAIMTCCRESVRDYQRACRGVGGRPGAPVMTGPSIVEAVWPAFDTVSWESLRRSEPKRARYYWEIPESEKVDFAICGTAYSGEGWCDFPRAQAARWVAARGNSVALYGQTDWVTEMPGQFCSGHPSLAPYFRGFHDWERQFYVYTGCRVNWVNFGAVGRGYINDRLPKVGGVGAFTLLDDRCALREDFTDGKEVVYYSGFEDWKQKFAWWLPKTDTRAGVGQAFRARILGEHTYAHRAAQILRLLGRL